MKHQYMAALQLKDGSFVTSFFGSDKIIENAEDVSNIRKELLESLKKDLPDDLSETAVIFNIQRFPI